MGIRLDELAWISRCKLFSDEKAFGKLVDAWSDRIRRFFLLQTGGDRMLSDDLAQETFIRVWNRLPELDQPAKFHSWVYRIAYNIWIDHIRRRKESSPLEGMSIEDDRGAESPADSHDLHRILMRELARLNDQERTAATLYYLSELSIKEICTVTGMADGTVKSHLSRARTKLRQAPELKRYHND